MVNGHRVVTKGDGAAVVKAIDGWRLLDLKPEQQAVLGGVVVKKQIVSMQVNRDVCVALGLRHARHVIDVRVGEQDLLEIEAFAVHDVEQPIDLVSRIDVHRLSRPLAGEHEPVLHERRDRRLVHQHHDRIEETRHEP